MQSDTLALINVQELTRLAGVNRTTAQRWKRGQSRPPAAVLTLIRYRYGGDAAAVLGAPWAGWRIDRAGNLHAPGWRRPFTPGEVLALPFLYGQIRALKAQLAAKANARRVCRAFGPQALRRAR